MCDLKTFDDLRDEEMREDPLEFLKLEIVGKLMAARDRKGLSQRDLSEITGVPQKTISRIESGKDVPKLQTLIKLSEALDLELTMVEKKRGSSTMGIT